MYSYYKEITSETKQQNCSEDPTTKTNKKHVWLCEQVLFVRFTIIPPRLTDQCNFITVL